MDAITRYKKDVHLYRPCDLRKDLKIYPEVASIAGHGLKPIIDWEEFEDRMDWYTVLRDPIKRQLSHFQYRVESCGDEPDLLTWLQTGRKARINTLVWYLTGGDDLEQAKETLATKFRAVGLVKHFNEFLLVWRERLGLTDFSIRYDRPKNQSGKSGLRKQILSSWEQYRSEVMETCELDVKLYEFAEKEIWPKQVEEYGKTRLEADLEREFGSNLRVPKRGWKYYRGLLRRNLRYKPMVWREQQVEVTTQAKDTCQKG